MTTYNGGNGEVLLLSILKETKGVITGDDTSLAGELIQNTHIDEM